MSNTTETLIQQLNDSPETVEFNQVISTISAHYHYTPVQFTNGEGVVHVTNIAGTNEGSCKIFGFALLHKLTEQQTLNCFGDYYRKDVLQNPEGIDHANIRNFIRSGWAGIVFEEEPLKVK